MSNRRVPQQERSRRKYEAILDAAASIIDERGLNELNAAAIAKAASVSTGAFYAYFDDRDAVVDALIDRYLDGFLLTLQEAFAHDMPETSAEASDLLIDRFVIYQREEPGFGELWHGGGLSSSHQEADRKNDQRLIATAAELFHQHGFIDTITDDVIQELGINWRIGDALIGLAFRNDPDGDAHIIAEAKRTIRLRIEADA